MPGSKAHAGTSLTDAVTTGSSETGRSDSDPGRLNPRWVEWLMGWPIGWASSERLETDRFHEFLRQHGVI